MKSHSFRIYSLLVLGFWLIDFTGLYGQTSSDASKNSSVIWKTFNDVSIPVPPKFHPRLYINPEQAKQLEERLAHPVLKGTVAGLKADAAKSVQMKIEWDAIHYLITKDPALGRSIIGSNIEFLKKTVLGGKNDAARETGRAMVTGSIVYDWLYELLSSSEKQEIIQELIRLAKTLECGYPPTRQGNVTGHSSESFILRDMISAGIAIYDEYPEMYEFAAARIFGESIPVRNFIYNGHAYHQGDSYGPLRYAWDTYPLFIFDRMGLKNIYNPEQRHVPYYYIYATRPDGSRMRSGDTYFHNFNKPGDPWHLYEGALFTASYYGDGVILDEFIRMGLTSNTKSWDNIFQFLWWDVNLQRVPVTTLPLSKYFPGPFGWMIARTSWDKNAVIAEMKLNEYNFVNHQHLDAGSFQIFYRAPLATESGLYTGTSGRYGSPHNLNYYKRTIAHNSLLIYNPQEIFRENHGNDGGQRLPNGRGEADNLNTILTKGYKTAEILAHSIGPDTQTPDYSYLKGDLAEAYSEKVSQVKRSFVFLNLKDADVPAALIVFDKVVSASPDFKKFWLLHSIQEPVVNGNEVLITQKGLEGTGVLVNTALLPETNNRIISPVGGKGKEFWVFGTNYENNPEMPAENTYENAAWRVEISPKNPSAEDYFLNVMQVMDDKIQKHEIQRIDAEKLTGVCISDRIVFFSKSSDIMGNEITFSVSGEKQYKILVTDLSPGKWKIFRNNQVIVDEMEVENTTGILYFEGSKGNYRVSKIK